MILVSSILKAVIAKIQGAERSIVNVFRLGSDAFQFASA